MDQRERPKKPPSLVSLDANAAKAVLETKADPRDPNARAIGWTKAWPPELISAGQGLKIVHDSFCAYRLKPTLRKNQTGWLAQS